jgi:hypothetical protein
LATENVTALEAQLRGHVQSRRKLIRRLDPRFADIDTNDPATHRSCHL